MRKILRARFPFPRITGFSGEDGDLWFAGMHERAARVADMLCGENCHTTSRSRIHRSLVLSRCAARAAGGAVSVFCAQYGAPGLHDPAGRAVEAPMLVTLTRALPDTSDALLEGLRDSSVREDMRRARKAGFTYRLTTDPEAVREFHGRHFVPFARKFHMQDGAGMPLGQMLAQLGQGGELLCADLDGEWVAGILNMPDANIYGLGLLGIRDADESVRQKRVISALIVQSLQRGRELGLPAANFGGSLPFLGKGPIWFKAKWGCTLRADSDVPRMLVFLDLRHEKVRRALTERPIVHFHNGGLAAVAWLPPEDAAIKSIVREAGRYPGISRWHVLGPQEALAAAAEALQGIDGVVPVPVEIRPDAPLWLGQILGDRA